MRTSAPPLQTLNLGSRHSPYRDYKGYNLCAQANAQLATELDEINVLLADFLQGTSAGAEGVWADEHLALLSDGQKSLPPALTALRETYGTLRQCRRLDSELGFTEILRRGEELARQSGARLAEAPELLAYGEARKAIAQWEAALPSLREKSRGDRCKKTKPAAHKTGKPSPVAFFATENSEGQKLWLFCDGVAVRGRASGAAELLLPKKRPPPKDKNGSAPYLESAARFPAAEMTRSPKLPERAAQDRSKDPAGEPEDPLSDESMID